MAAKKIPAKTIKKTGSAFHRLGHFLFNPRKFFKSIIVDGSLDAPIIKALAYGLIGGGLTFVLQLMHGHPTTLGTLFSEFITTPVFALLTLFALAGVLMLVAEVTGGDRDFETAAKGLAAIFFLYPVMLALNALAFNCTSIWIISLAVDAYILFLLYNIGVYCLNGKKMSVKIVILLAGLLMLMVYATDYRLAWFLMKNATATLSCIY
ncbi:MAG: YIP1 family protein [Rickettsiales bacterium]|nr:YIP1 family protein [Rickettsiales bacterium]